MKGRRKKEEEEESNGLGEEWNITGIADARKYIYAL